MGLTTVTVTKVDRNAYRDLRAFTFTYQLRPGISTNACRGICWDGQQLVFTTNGQAALERSNFIGVDPGSGTMLWNVEPPATVGGFTADHVDVCFDGHNYYVIRQDSVQGNGIDKYSPAPDCLFQRTVVTGLANTETALDFNGKDLVTLDAAAGGGARTVRFYDPDSGALIRSNTLLGGGISGGGIVVDRSYPPENHPTGSYYSYVVKQAEDFIGGLIYYHTLDPSNLGVLLRIGNRTIVGQDLQSMPLTWDGAFLWEFYQSTV